MTRSLPLVLVSLGWLLPADLAVAEEYATHQPPAAGYHDIAGNLTVEPPKNIGGPFPYVVRPLRQGDLTLLQIRYPIVPPMPQAVTISSEKGCVEYLGVAHTASDVAILTREQQSNGKIGVGYVQLVVRASKVGKDRLTVHVKLADGTVKGVPYAFDVTASAR